MKRVHSDIKRKEIHNTWDDSTIPSDASAKHHYLKQSGGMEVHELVQQKSLQCGHLGESHGLCAECHGAICASCFVNCSYCHKPLGPCHGKEDKKSREWYCQAHYRSMKRTRFWAGLSNFFGAALLVLLAPFVGFDKHTQSQQEQDRNA